MTNEQILNKAIDRAIENGWQEGEAHRNLVYLYPRMMGKKYIISCYYKSIIFSHDFAEAFWKYDITKSYLYHLQQMILEKEPLKYLEKSLR